VTNISCHGDHNGHINTTVTGGTPGYTYSWSNGCHAADPSGLAAGTYHLVVTDAHGCHADAAYTVTEPCALSVRATTENVSCHGGHNGHISVYVTGGTPGYTYSWSHGCHITDPSELSAGTYTLTVTDAHGCTATAVYTITEPAALSVTGVVTNVTCHDGHNGRINTTVTGGTPCYSYLWSNSAHVPDLTDLCAGTYSVIVADANGCSGTASYVVTQPADSHCGGGSDGHGDGDGDGEGHHNRDGGPCIRVYPNPTNGICNVIIPAIHKHGEIHICDITGKIIDRRSVTENNGEPCQFNLANYKTGIYLIKVNCDETTYTEKLILR
jgi:type IX secretion system substrate protein/SprB-like repeat protein